MHDFSFIADGRVFATQKILIVQGQRNRFITASVGKAGRGAVAADESAVPTDEQLPATRPARAKTGAAAKRLSPRSPPRPSRRHPKRRGLPSGAGSSLVLTGVGVAALGTGAVLTLWGRNDNKNLSNCAPNCADTTLSHIKRVYQGADIAIGVGVAALAAAYWSYAFASGSSESKGRRPRCVWMSPRPPRAVSRRSPAAFRPGHSFT